MWSFHFLGIILSLIFVHFQFATGEFGFVYKAIYRNDQVAVKFLKG